MATKKKDDKEVRVAPLFELTSPEGVEEVKTNERAWVRATEELTRPVQVKLLRWVRVD